MTHRPGGSRRSRRRELKKPQPRRQSAPDQPPGWADLAGYRGDALEAATQVLPLVRPLMTLGADWRSRRNAR